MAILGMVVALKTFNSEDAGTDDEIYLGMWGTGGGREFPLSSPNHDDFERNEPCRSSCDGSRRDD